MMVIFAVEIQIFWGRMSSSPGPHHSRENGCSQHVNHVRHTHKAPLPLIILQDITAVDLYGPIIFQPFWYITLVEDSRHGLVGSELAEDHGFLPGSCQRF